MSMISHSVANHQELRRRLCEIEPDLDDETLADTLEGLTDLNELLAAVLRAALADEAMADGLRGFIKTMQARLGRLEERAGKRRLLVRDAMIEADIKKIAAPDATISLRPGSPAVVIVDEHAVPSDYWQPREPRLDRQGMLAALKVGTAIPGAMLSNPEPVLNVRVR